MGFLYSIMLSEWLKHCQEPENGTTVLEVTTGSGTECSEYNYMTAINMTIAQAIFQDDCGIIRAVSGANTDEINRLIGAEDKDR